MINEPVYLEIDSIVLMAIIGNLQLALSHPKNNGLSSDLMLDFIISMKNELINIDPFYGVLIDAGFERGSES